jgi:type I restriction-modification system DNA methylase subunit
MTITQQRATLQSQIWKIANDVRGAVDGWDFKQYVLGTLFYRFISENVTSYIEAGDESINYATLSDQTITPEIKVDAIKTKGYFMYPNQLFVNVANAGKSGGEFFTPQHVSKLIAQLAIHNQSRVNKIKKETNNNVMNDDHIKQIMDLFDRKENVAHVAMCVPNETIAANDYNLSVSSYVEAKNTREVVDITTLNDEIERTVSTTNHLRADIATIVAEIEGEPA